MAIFPFAILLLSLRIVLALNLSVEQGLIWNQYYTGILLLFVFCLLKFIVYLSVLMCAFFSLCVVIHQNISTFVCIQITSYCFWPIWWRITLCMRRKSYVGNISLFCEIEEKLRQVIHVVGMIICCELIAWYSLLLFFWCYFILLYPQCAQSPLELMLYSKNKMLMFGSTYQMSQTTKQEAVELLVLVSNFKDWCFSSYSSSVLNS